MSTIAIQSLPSGTAEARRIAARLGVPAHEIAVHTFPDTEILVTVAPATETVIAFASLDRPNEKLIALLLAAEALRRGGTRRLVLVAPYLCYMRQDTSFRTGEAISQRVVGKLLAQAFDRVVTVDAHLHRTSDLGTVFPGIAADDLPATAPIAEFVRSRGLDPATVVVGPDAESKSWIRELAVRLGLPYMAARKKRNGDRSVDVELPEPHAVNGRPVLLLDDLVSSGATLATCARALIAAGAVTIDAVATHALFPPEALDEFVRAGIRSFRSTTSVPHPTNAIGLDGILAAALTSEIAGTGLKEPLR